MWFSHPILTCAQAREVEARLFGNDEALEWAAMCRAGRALARAVQQDFLELGPFPAKGRVLVLAGKGHNGGDAMLAALGLLEARPGLGVDLVLAHGEVSLRPLARRALRQLVEQGGERVRQLSPGALPEGGDFLLSLDGLYGFQYRPPMEPRAAALLSWSNQLAVRMRVAVDLPSGLDGPAAFEADFTYATGIVKSPLLSCSNAGRLRYLDLGFFDAGCQSGELTDWVLHDALLAPLRGFRAPRADKRSFGHVHVVAGSRQFPGAALMSVLGALKSGAGLVTGHVPESLVASFAARAPEAMWVGWPETPEGSLALEGFHLLQQRFGRASSLVLGPGLGREPETLLLAERIVGASQVPVVIDADALQARVVQAGSCARILTPHAGEYLRISGASEPRLLGGKPGVVLVLKGPVTQVISQGLTGHSFCGGPVLARGGSGDLLAGLMGGLLAQEPGEPTLAAARAVLWQGRAADLLARAQGAVSVTTTELLDWLPQALRRDADE